MKVVAIIEYNGIKEQIHAHYEAHREYLRQFLTNEQLRAAGPFADNAGALWVLEVQTTDEAEEMVKRDPFVEAGVIVNWQIRPLDYWSAKAAKGT
jgi:uncharacterized protein